MELEKHLQAIQTDYDNLIKSHEQGITELKARHAKEMEVCAAFTDFIEFDAIITAAEAEEVSPTNWLIDVILNAIRSPNSQVIKVRQDIHEQLRNLAESRGMNLDELTCRDGLSDIIKTALLNRRF